MQNQWEKKVKTNHIIALTFAIVFHIGAIYALTGGASNFDAQKLVPDFAKEWLDTDKDANKKDSKKTKDRA